ncbi:MAG: ABC transporter permease [Sphaerochaetaceae bacterium]|jgi:ribose transport system permease protein|nr:ABC transporter permease [Sphaerochaetaceae bacterium]
MKSISVNSKKDRQLESLGTVLQKWGVFIGLILLMLFFSIKSRHFFSIPNFLNIARQTSITAIIAVGMTYVIIINGIDLSVGAIVGLAGVLCAVFITNLGMNPLLAIVLVLVVSAVIGLIIGATVAYIKIPPFIITLAMQQIVRGVAFVITSGYPVYLKNPLMNTIGRGFFLGIPTPVYIMAVIFIAGGFMLHRMRLGRYIYAVGGNIQTARLSGIKVERVIVIVYILIAVFCGISGVILSGRLSSGTPNAGTGFEMDVIAATILGGTSFAGGEGTVFGTLIGALLMGVLSNGLNIMNVDPYIQMIIKGFVIFLAVFLSVINSRKSEEK